MDVTHRLMVVAFGAILAVGCNGGGGGTPDPSEPLGGGETTAAGGEETSEPDTGAPRTFASGSFSATVTGDVETQIEADLNVGGLTNYTPGNEFSPAHVQLQFGALDAGNYVLMSLVDTDPPGTTFTTIINEQGYTDQDEGHCTVEYDLSSDGVDGTITCTGLPADDDSGTVDLNGTFEGTFA